MTPSTTRLWDDAATPRSVQTKTGVKVLFLAIGSLFFLFVVAYITRSAMGDYELLTAPWQPLATPSQLWLNTGMLVLASLTLEFTKQSTLKNQSKSLEALIIAGIFTLGFIAGQMAVWYSLTNQGFTFSGNPAHSFFYLLTGLHALHILAGLIAWGLAIDYARKPAPHSDARVLHSKIERCALYWHFLLAIWLVLLALLTSSPESFEAFAAFCGLR